MQVRSGVLSDVPEDPTTAPMAKEKQITDEAFETMVRDHQRRIFRILLLLLRDSDEADSLTQECFIRAYTRRASFRGEASLGTWLVRIAINLAHDHRRSRRNAFWRRLRRGKDVETEMLADHRRTPEAATAAKEMVEAIWTAVADLPVKPRTAFTLRFAEDMSLEDIANIMRLRTGTVKAHLWHAVNAVKNELAYAPKGKVPDGQQDS